MPAAQRVHFKHILCPTDFSDFSRSALRHAAALARRFDAQLSVLHVIPFAAYGAALPYMPTLPLVTNPALRELAAADLRELVEPLRSERVGFALEVREGEPWREIRDAAERLPADLLVLGTHGRGGFERMLLGSVTEKLLRSVACPVMTVCREEGRTWQAPGLLSRILCATDLTPSSDRTIAFALSLAAETQARVTLLHVVESKARPADKSARSAPRLGRPAAGGEGVDAAGLVLMNAVPPEARAWCEIVERVETGRAREAILRVAAEERSDAIVVGSRGQAGIDTLVFGSTAIDVVRAATCPVFVARDPLRGADHRELEARQMALAPADAPET